MAAPGDSDSTQPSTSNQREENFHSDQQSEPPHPHPHFVRHPPRGMGPLQEARTHGTGLHRQSFHSSLGSGQGQDPRASVTEQPTLHNQRALDKLAERENNERAQEGQQQEEHNNGSDEAMGRGVETSSNITMESTFEPVVQNGQSLDQLALFRLARHREALARHRAREAHRNAQWNDSQPEQDHTPSNDGDQAQGSTPVEDGTVPPPILQFHHFRTNPLLAASSGPATAVISYTSSEQPQGDISTPAQPDLAQAEPDVEVEYYPKSFSDIHTVSGILSSLLLPELVDDILELAEYWIHEIVERSTQLSVRENTSPIVYVASEMIGINAQWPATTIGESLAGNEDQVDSRKVKSKRDSGPVKKIVFTLRSHDQGWSSYPEDEGTFRNSWTWFEVALTRPRPTLDPSSATQTNGSTDNTLPNLETPAHNTPEPPAYPTPHLPHHIGARVGRLGPQPPPSHAHTDRPDPPSRMLEAGSYRPVPRTKRAPSPGQATRTDRRRLATNRHATRVDEVRVVSWYADVDRAMMEQPWCGDPAEGWERDEKKTEAEVRAANGGDARARRVRAGAGETASGPGDGTAQQEVVGMTDEEREKLLKEKEEDAQWVRRLQVGDVVHVEAWAQFGGWTNHVGGMKIEVFLGV